MLPSLNFLAAYQDYLWFLSLLGWGVVAFIWWRSFRTEENWGWLIWSAASGAGIAVTELVMLAIPVEPSPAVPVHLVGDLLLGGLGLFQVWGWSHAWLKTWRARSLAAVVVVELVVIWRRWLPEGSNVLLALAALFAAVLWLRRLSAPGRLAQAALLLAWATSWASSFGVIADWFGESRRWMEVSQAGLIGATVQLAAALVSLAALRRAALARWSPELAAERAGDLRWLTLWSGAWLLLGFGLATWSGWTAQRTFEQSALTRVQAMASSLDRAALARSLGPEFRLEKLEVQRQPSGQIIGWAQAPFQLSEACRPVRAALARLQGQNPDLRSMSIRTHRDDAVVQCLNSWPTMYVAIEQRVTEADRLDWANRVTDFRGLRYPSKDEVCQARTPLTGPDGDMLGWLVLDFGVSSWLAVQTEARQQAFAVVGLGLALIALASGQRWRGRERESARREAAVAHAGERLKAAFLAKVSHELRTPLQSILGYGELARGATNQPGVQRQLDAILEQGRLLSRLVNDLIDLSAIEAGGLRLVPQLLTAPAALMQAAESLRAAAEAKQLTFAVRSAEVNTHPLLADPERLRQIVLNLVGNAVKFTARGSVTVDVICAPHPGETMAVTVAVTDTGPGIAPAHRARLFQPYSRLEVAHPQEGAGLGLAIAAALCAQMGGGIEVESDGRSGSTFRATVVLPRAAPSEALARSMANPRYRFQGKRILIADDNTLVRQLFTEHLAALGAECLVARDGAEAWARAEREELFAAVIDISMPGLDGLSVARRIRARLDAGRQPRLIAASAHARPEDRAVALAAGFDAYLVKPVALNDLTAALDGAGSAPGVSLEALRLRLRVTFVAEVPGQAARLAESISRREWDACRAQAHHLKNSAYVIEDSALMSALAHLESAAAHRDSAVLTEAWRETQRALVRWLPARS